MGHKTSLNAIYARMDQAIELLIEGYKEAEPNLSIYQNTKTITELKEKVDKQSEDIEQLVTNLSLRNARLENEMIEVKEQWNKDFKGMMTLWQKDGEEYQKMINDLVERVQELEIT